MASDATLRCLIVLNGHVHAHVVVELAHSKLGLLSDACIVGVTTSHVANTTFKLQSLSWHPKGCRACFCCCLTLGLIIVDITFNKKHQCIPICGRGLPAAAGGLFGSQQQHSSSSGDAKCTTAVSRAQLARQQQLYTQAQMICYQWMPPPSLVLSRSWR
jgi:hypothetical protein